MISTSNYITFQVELQLSLLRLSAEPLTDRTPREHRAHCDSLGSTKSGHSLFVWLDDNICHIPLLPTPSPSTPIPTHTRYKTFFFFCNCATLNGKGERSCLSSSQWWRESNATNKEACCKKESIRSNYLTCFFCNFTLAIPKIKAE